MTKKFVLCSSKLSLKYALIQGKTPEKILRPKRRTSAPDDRRAHPTVAFGAGPLEYPVFVCKNLGRLLKNSEKTLYRTTRL